ncbi:iron(III) transport system substrate-binding protein [Hydrogenispora ethanolica]|uniref:Iron(III) transport system substrate-binding protein n=1 Tax=Hydrogenispora ethanolica TaxID=1082276 RepID=A0A4R1R838_HYDET|nr:iron(III) transport system substrate-binding protein [Hydrogenispora ethanolica]
MLKRLHIVLSLALVLVLAMSFTSLAAEKITAYVSCDEELARQLLTAFTKATGIQVDWVRLSTGEAQARIAAEKNNPQASIWVGGVGLDHIAAKKDGLTTPYFSPKASRIPKQFKDKEGFWCGMYAGPLCFVYNTEKLAEKKLPVPKSWADLLKPVYKGQIQMANPQTSGTAYNVITTMITVYKGDEAKAFDYMKQLNKNVSQYTRSGAAPGKNAALGETPIALGYAHDQVKLISQGYPLKIVFPKEGTGFEVASMSMIKGGPQADTAKKLYDWMLDRDAAKIMANFFLSVFAKVPLKEGAIPLNKVKVVNQDDEWAGKNKDRLVEKWLNEVYQK